MNDLFDSLNEIREERAGICEFDGLLNREQAEKQGMLESERYRRSCEVRTALAMPLADRQDFLRDVDRKRGKAAGDALRTDIQAEWLRRKSAKAESMERAIDMAGQA